MSDFHVPTVEEFSTKYPQFKPIHQREYLIAGELRTWSGPTTNVIGAIPIRDGETVSRLQLGSYPNLTTDVAMEALNAAMKAYDHGRGAWPSMPIKSRIKKVEEFVFLMLKQREEVVRLLMLEIGKSEGDSKKEFDRTVEYIADTISALKDLDRTSSRFAIEKGILAQIRRSPLGVVLCMGPYNYPLNETFTTLIPALIMGNCVIFKPPRFGALLHYPLLKAFQTAFPPGVVNTLYGDGRKVVGPLMETGKIDVLAFIGSSRVANILKHQHPKPSRLRCVLGLEAKNVAIVTSHANLRLAAKEVVLGALSFNGQRCTALKLVYVAKEVIDEFTPLLLEEIANLKRGLPWENAFLTPLPDPGSLTFLRDLVDDAIKKGAKVINDHGGEIIGNAFFNPAVLFPTDESMKVFGVEQFGPVVPMTTFNDISEPLDTIIRSDFGQQVSIFGTDSDEIARLVDVLVNQVCRVNINSQCQRGPDSFPFTGRKDSAEGTLSVSDALRVFSIRSLVAARNEPVNQELVTDIVKDHKSAFLSTDFIF